MGIRLKLYSPGMVRVKRLAFIFSVMISFHSRSQQLIKDTVIHHTSHKLTPFGVQLNSGVAKYWFDPDTEKYFGNYWSPAIRLNFYSKNFIIGLGLRPITLNTRDTLFFDQYALHTHQDVRVINGVFILGYKIEVVRNFSLEPYIGGVVTHFSLAHPTQGVDVESPMGYTLGVSINKYFEKFQGQYLVVFLNANFNKSNYSQVHSDLGDSFYAMEFGLAYMICR